MGQEPSENRALMIQNAEISEATCHSNEELQRQGCYDSFSCCFFTAVTEDKAPYQGICFKGPILHLVKSMEKSIEFNDAI